MVTQMAVVWDLDGVIVDSGEAHNASWSMMARDFGVHYDPDHDFRAIFGRHNTDIISSLWNVTDEARIVEMTDSKEGYFRKEAATLKALPGVVELMAALRREGWKQAIGSSAPMKNIELLLSATGTGGYIDAVASGDDVSRGKPDPQVFLIAFERLGVAPRYGVVIEDAPAGVRAGVRAGAAVLAVTNTQASEVLVEAGAHRVVESLAGVTVADLQELVSSRSIFS